MYLFYFYILLKFYFDPYVFFTSIVFGGGGTTIQFCLGHPFGQQRPCTYALNSLTYEKN